MSTNDLATGQSGYVIITVAVLLAVLLGFSALAVDSGVLYSSRTAAQRIADSAALAGASSFISDPGAAQPTSAETEARAFSEGKLILGDPVQAGEVFVRVDIPNRRVTVDIVRTEETYLAKAIGFMNTDVGVTATAEAGSAFVGSDCVKPWFIPNSMFADPATTGDPDDTTCSACLPAGHADYSGDLRNQFLLVENGLGQLEVTTHTRTMIANMTPFRIKPNNPKQALKPSQFYAIAMSNGRGAAKYGANILGCSGLDDTTPSPVLCADCYESEPGNMVGPTTSNTEQLIGFPNQDVLIQTSPELVVEDYQQNEIDPLQSPSRVTVPIWDVCSDGSPLTGCSSPTGFCPGETLSAGGRNINFKVIGFADLFISNVNKKDGVDGYLLGVHACPQGNAGISPGVIDSSNVNGFPLRLVRLPSASP